MTESVAVRVPRALGVNVTLTLQLPCMVRPFVQSPPPRTIAKSDAFGPEMKTPLVEAMVTTPPALSIANCGALVVPVVWVLKLMLGGLKEGKATEFIPVPVTVTVRGLPGSLSKMVNVAVCVPTAFGE
jgi:hypothetical protein